MASEWSWRTLDDLGAIKTGKTPPSSLSDAYGRGVPFVTPRDLNGRKYIRSTERELANAGLEAVIKCAIRGGSVLVSCIGSDMGKAAIAPNDSVTNQQINSIEVDSHKCSEFVYYNLSMRKREIQMMAGGSAQPILNKTDFGTLPIYCPPLLEQKAIAHILGTLDDKIELNRQTNQTLEAMAQALFKSWFVDFDPVIDNALAASKPIPDALQARAAQQKNQPAKHAATQNIHQHFPNEFSYTEQLGWIPKGWDVTTLRAEVDVLNGHAFKSADYEKNGTFVLRTKNFNSQNGVSRLSDDVFLPSVFLESHEKYLCQPFDYHLVMVGASVGNRGLIEPHQLPALRNQNMWCFRPNSTTVLGRPFVKNLLDSIVDEKLRLASGSAREFFRKGDFQSHFMVIPSVSAATSFDDLAVDLLEKQAANNYQSLCLAKLRNTLLPKLISGELRIPDAEKLMTEAGL